MAKDLDYFKLMRNFWDWAFENPEIIKPNHCALFAFIVEHCNRLGWKHKFGLPTTMAMEAIGIKSYNTYINTMNELVDFGLIEMIERSKNQYSANIVALLNFDKALDKALDKAFIKHTTKQRQSTSQSNSSIDKQDTNIQSTIELYSFLEFWEDYDYKTGKAAAEKSWKKLTPEEKTRVKETVKDFRSYKPFPDYQHPMPSSYLNQKRFNDEIETLKEEKIDVNLWVKNHLTYDESLGEVAIRCDNYPEYNGLYYNRKTSKFQKEKAI
jgi:hypothetical protein